MSTVDATVEGEILRKNKTKHYIKKYWIIAIPGSTSVYIEMWELLLCYAKLKC